MWNRWSSIESTSTILQLQLLNFVVSVDHGKTPPPKTSLIGDHGISATSLKIISHWLRFFLSSPSSHFPQQATSRGGSGLDFSSKQKTIQCQQSRLVMVCDSLELGTNVVDWRGEQNFPNHRVRYPSSWKLACGWSFRVSCSR